MLAEREPVWMARGCGWPHPLGEGILLALLLICGVWSGAQAAPGAIDVAVNQVVTAQTSAALLEQGASPKKLWEQYGKGYGGRLYVQVYRFAVTPGEKYTFYGFFRPDGIYRNVYLRGDNPLTDHTASYGDTSGFLTTFVVWSQQPGTWQCPEVTRRYNFSIAAKSATNRLYAIATSKTPQQSFRMVLKHPADPDADVEKNSVDPSCPPKKGQSWGQAWRNPFLLRLDPSEQPTGSTGPAGPVAAQPAPPQPPQTSPQRPPQPSSVPGSRGQGFRLEAEQESSYHVADAQRSLKLGPGNHSTTSSYWYLAAGGDWLMYQVEIRQAGAYYLWIKDYNDRKHPAESRTVDILVDGRGVASAAATSTPGREHWGWHVAAVMELSAGTHLLTVRKQATTSAAALVDALYLTPDPTDRPAE